MEPERIRSHIGIGSAFFWDFAGTGTDPNPQKKADNADPGRAEISLEIRAFPADIAVRYC